MSLAINIVVDERKLRELVASYLNNQLGDLAVRAEEITIEVKSKQNFKSEWEAAAFRARVDVQR